MKVEIFDGLGLRMRRVMALLSGLFGSGRPFSEFGADQFIMCLKAGEIRSIDHVHGDLEVSAKSGVFWLTEEIGNEDHIIRPGRVFQSGQPGRMVIEALEAGCLILHDRACHR